MESQLIDNADAYLEDLTGYDVDFVLTASDEDLVHSAFGTILSDVDHALPGGLSLPTDGGFMASGLLVVPLLVAVAMLAFKMIRALGAPRGTAFYAGVRRR